MGSNMKVLIVGQLVKLHLTLSCHCIPLLVYLPRLWASWPWRRQYPPQPCPAPWSQKWKSCGPTRRWKRTCKLIVGQLLIIELNENPLLYYIWPPVPPPAPTLAEGILALAAAISSSIFSRSMNSNVNKFPFAPTVKRYLQTNCRTIIENRIKCELAILHLTAPTLAEGTLVPWTNCRSIGNGIEQNLLYYV